MANLQVTGHHERDQFMTGATGEFGFKHCKKNYIYHTQMAPCYWRDGNLLQAPA